MFYVYTLIDPRDGTVFYVGKGMGNRVAAHEREAKKGVAHPKCERIREIWAAGKQVVRKIVERFSDEKAAYEYEAKLILELRKQLTNIALGGQVGRRSKEKKVTVRQASQLVALAIWAKRNDPGRWHQPFRRMVHQVMAEMADETIAKFSPLADREMVKEELLRRGIRVVSKPIAATNGD